MTMSLLKMEEAQTINVYKITTTKIKDFDEAISVVRIGEFKVKNVLLDGGSGMNNIFENLRKKVGLKKPKPVPFCSQDG